MQLKLDYLSPSQEAYRIRRRLDELLLSRFQEPATQRTLASRAESRQLYARLRQLGYPTNYRCTAGEPDHMTWGAESDGYAAIWEPSDSARHPGDQQQWHSGGGQD